MTDKLNVFDVELNDNRCIYRININRVNSIDKNIEYLNLGAYSIAPAQLFKHRH